MKELQLKSQRFRAEREWDWRRLDGLLRKVEGRSASQLSDEELHSCWAEKKWRTKLFRVLR